MQSPWALAFLPDGRFLVTERPGTLRVVEAHGAVSAPLAGVPPVAAGGQGGLLDVLLDSDFASNRTVYLCYAEPGTGGNSTALARTTLAADRSSLQDVKVLFSQQPKVASSAHFGCRITEGRQAGGQLDGTLFLALGERFSRKDDAQRLDNHHGKIVRIGKDGNIPADNPFNTPAARRDGALPEIWSYGHRNPQGMVRAPDGALWEIEHGPQGGDELNVVARGRNYGWPAITYGENYGGGKIGAGLTAQAGMEQPLHYWVPSIAPSGMDFITSERYGKAWVGNLVVGSLKFGYLARLELSAPFGGKVVRETKLLPDLGERVRDVRQGPDGLLYLLTDSPAGRLLRVVPR
ncbi:MAG: PQQ-dependent sugar dehydrogenase [Rhodoferax sp.]|nr:PQQ-dependent sugar dehydrogenase [Rhodoferax sp.]MDZ7919781.1 PQQ-dependent sugar dehydrogenase [Rhodoferax sp.]